jgi:hypothetical protein
MTGQARWRSPEEARWGSGELGKVRVPAAVLIRPDGHVAWAGGPPTGAA